MSSNIIALSLSHSPLRHRANALLSLCERLLDMLAAHAPEDPSVNSAAFKERLEGWRRELRGEEDEAHVTRLTDEIAVTCDAFLDHIREYRLDREAELLELMQVFREAIDAVRGDSMKLEKDLLHSTTEMGRMIELEDIRELKRALAREVQSIRAAVAEKQESEARHFDRLTSRVQTLEQSLVKAKTEAATDALTQLPNRGAFDQALREWLDRASRDRRAFTVAMVDLDDFKRVNDTYGHPVGDRVIITAAKLLREAVVAEEFVSRFGGEEFALLLTSPASGARERLTTLLTSMPAAFEYTHEGARHSLSFSFSGGVTAYVPGDTPESIVKRADEALYDAKRRGKKRIETKSRSLLRGLIG